MTIYQTLQSNYISFSHIEKKSVQFVGIVLGILLLQITVAMLCLIFTDKVVLRVYTDTQIQSLD